jgi:hypothetical protein
VLPKPLPEDRAAVTNLHASLAVRHELRGNEYVHGVKFATREEVIEPALDDVYVF